MKHSDWPAFQASIVANPDDDTLRLVAADFLEENGDPDRAAFIRAQVELTRLESSDLMKSPEADRARRVERLYLGPTSEFVLLWAAEDCPELVRVTPPVRSSSPLSRLQVEGAGRLRWHRGFVDEVHCTAAEWLKHGVAVRRCNPVRFVLLNECERVAREVWYANLDALRGLPSVEVYCPTTRNEEEIAQWLRPWLPGTDVTFIPF